MYSKSRRSIVLTLFLLSICSLEISGQSSFVKSGLNGAQFEVNTGFDPSGIVKSFGGKIGYSIGGILDLGGIFSVEMDEIESRDVNNTSIGLAYGLMLIKQEKRTPFSARIGGAYCYSFIDSSIYNEANLQKEGHGFDVRFSLLRDFNFGELVMLRFGLFGEFSSYNYTILDRSLQSEELQEFSTQRETGFKYGSVLVFAKKNTRARTFYLGVEPVMDEDFTLSISTRTGVVLEM
ncbi:hypothetical protein [Marispirochaeta aestuarii]|uniref:hypothetical protein n=1 Tax=Marispirochaeta aestuarii TaxID=1963862 RepID=UPI002ABE13FE|nr:hypothetical protein [Marispirochaeta aestuarii]